MAAFIKFDGVDGESLDKDHKGWCDLISFSHCIHQSGEGATAGRRAGSVIVDNYHCSKDMCKAGPKIAEKALSGKVFPKVEIHQTASFTDAGRKTYYAVELKNVLIKSYTTTGGKNSTLTEAFALNFSELKVTYTETGQKGDVKGQLGYSWKVEEGGK